MKPRLARLVLYLCTGFLLSIIIAETKTLNPAAVHQQRLQMPFEYKCNGERVVVKRCFSEADDAYCSVQYPDRKGPKTNWLTPELAEKRGELIKKLQACGALASSQPTGTRPTAPPTASTGNSADAYEKEGDRYREAKDFPKAIAAYKRAIALSPSLSTAHYGLALVYDEQRQWQLAIPAWKQAMALKPEANAFILLGIAHAELQQYDEAMKAYRSAISLKPESDTLANAHINIGHAYSSLKQYDNAVTAYREALRLNPNNAYFHESLGVLYFNLEQYANAVAALKQAILLKPGFTVAHYGLGMSYVRMGKKEDALRVYRTLQTLDKATAQKLYDEINKPASSQPVAGTPPNRRRTGTSQPAGRPAPAAKETQPAAQPSGVTNSDTEWATYASEADEYYNAKDYVKAIEPYKRAIFHSTGLNTFYGSASVGSDNPNDDQQWLNAVKRHQRGNPADAIALILLGDAHRNLEQDNEALEAYRRAISLKPDSATLAKAHFRSAQVYHGSLKEYEKALGSLNAALRLLPGDPSGHNLLGETYYNLKQFPKALGEFQKVIQLNRNNSGAPYWIGKTYNAMGRFAEAIVPLQESIRMRYFGTADANYELGLAHLNLKQYDAAVAAFQQAIRVKLDKDKKDFPDAHYALGLTYVGMGRKQEALRIYRGLQAIDAQKAATLLTEIQKN